MDLHRISMMTKSRFLVLLFLICLFTCFDGVLANHRHHHPHYLRDHYNHSHNNHHHPPVTQPSPPPQSAVHHKPGNTPTADPSDCTSALINVDGCIEDLISSFFAKNFTLHANCCHAVSRLSENCFDEAFISVPSFRRRVISFCDNHSPTVITFSLSD